MPIEPGGDDKAAERGTPFDREFLEVVRTVHPEVETLEELLDAAYRMTAMAELATGNGVLPVKSDRSGRRT